MLEIITRTPSTFDTAVKALEEFSYRYHVSFTGDNIVDFGTWLDAGSPFALSEDVPADEITAWIEAESDLAMVRMVWAWLLSDKGAWRVDVCHDSCPTDLGALQCSHAAAFDPETLNLAVEEMMHTEIDCFILTLHH